MSRLPGKRIASAATVALLPVLVLGGQPQAGADVGAASSKVISSAYQAAPTPTRATARVTGASKKWTLVLSTHRSAAQAQSVWRASASFRAVKHRPVARLQIRQIVNGRLKAVRTKAVRTGSDWKRVSVSLQPARASSTLQVLVRRGKRASVPVRVTKIRVADATGAVFVAPQPTAPSTPTNPEPTLPPITIPPTNPEPTPPPTTIPPTIPEPTPPPPALPDPTPPPVNTLPGWGAPDWSDEFNGTAVDPTKWNVRTRSNLGLTIDSAIPDAGQVSVSNGILHLKGDWLPDAPQARSTSATGVNILTHKTGYIDQRKIQTGNVYRGQRWGRWEIRAKTPTGTNTLGALAAFWLRNANSGEIDIMEAWGYGADFPTAGKAIKDTAATTIFGDTTTTASRIALIRHKENGAPGVPWSGFHTYAFELLPDRAAIVVDGKTIWTATPSTLPGLWGSAFQSPLHMRLNLHVGPSAAYWGLPDATKKYLTQPLDYQVDYVRTWAAPNA